MGLELAVGKIIREQLVDFFQECKEHNINVSGKLCAHSQGVAIINNLVNDDSFHHGGFQKNFTQMLCLGGPVIVPGASNVMAFGDPVCLLALLNIGRVIEAISQGNLHIVFPSAFEFPHNFEGTAYQHAIDTFIAGRRI